MGSNHPDGRGLSGSLLRSRSDHPKTRTASSSIRTSSGLSPIGTEPGTSSRESNCATSTESSVFSGTHALPWWNVTQEAASRNSRERQRASARAVVEFSGNGTTVSTAQSGADSSQGLDVRWGRRPAQQLSHHRHHQGASASTRTPTRSMTSTQPNPHRLSVSNSINEPCRDDDGNSLVSAPGPEPTRVPHENSNHDDTPSRRTKALITTRIQSDSRANIALQLTGAALHLSLVKSLARLHQRSKAAPAAERNVGWTKSKRQPYSVDRTHGHPLLLRSSTLEPHTPCGRPAACR